MPIAEISGKGKLQVARKEQFIWSAGMLGEMVACNGNPRPDWRTKEGYEEIQRFLDWLGLEATGPAVNGEMRVKLKGPVYRTGFQGVWTPGG